MDIIDLFVIGGGINGCGIAADAAGRGLSVFLCEQHDLASGTSWTSSKLIHGGLRYLEYYEFKLVHEALKEREILLRKAPHLIQALRFVLPHHKHLRPVWMIRIGLFLYDHLAGRKQLKKSEHINLRKHLAGQSLKTEFKNGFIYSDCRVDDARLVITNALDAQAHGAHIRTRTRCTAVHREKDYWSITLQGPQGSETVFAKAIVNAAGPWVADVIQNVLNVSSHCAVKWVKGSHFIIPKLYEGAHAYILQNQDKRIVFAIPYDFTDSETNRYTLIGTTDVDYHGDLNHISISNEEAVYLCELINEYFQRAITPEDIIWSYAGVRPLYDDQSGNPSATTREYHFELDDAQGTLPVLSIFGGKITTYRMLAEHALQKLSPYFKDLKKPWTAHAILPGGDISSVTEYSRTLKKSFAFLSDETLYRFAHSYGSRTLLFLSGCTQLSDLGLHFGADLYEKEVRYLIEHEWADDAFGIVWLRSKLGLHLSAEEITRLDQFVKEHPRALHK